MKVLHSGDQLPLGPHSDAVGWEESVEDFERDKGGEKEVLQRIADGGGTLADHADVRRCDEELEETRARVLKAAVAQRQRILFQLRNSESDARAHDERRSHINVCRCRQAFELDREPAELIRRELQAGRSESRRASGRDGHT
jgi:hypothetical protein